MKGRMSMARITPSSSSSTSLCTTRLVCAGLFSSVFKMSWLLWVQLLPSSPMAQTYTSGFGSRFSKRSRMSSLFWSVRMSPPDTKVAFLQRGQVIVQVFSSFLRISLRQTAQKACWQSRSLGTLQMLYLLKQIMQSISRMAVSEHCWFSSDVLISGELVFVSTASGPGFGESCSKTAGLKAAGQSLSVPEDLSISSVNSTLFSCFEFCVTDPAPLISAAPPATGTGLSASACTTPGADDLFSLFGLSVDFSMEINLGAACLPLAEGFPESLAPFMCCCIPDWLMTALSESVLLQYDVFMTRGPELMIDFPAKTVYNNW